MTSLIIRILIFILAIWLLRQLLTIFILKKKTGSASGKTSNSGKNMVKDPVCGMYMDPRLAVKHETKTGVFYFCSEQCKNKFLLENSGQQSSKTPPGE
ncbi:MAG: YHS domain-containing protein [Acidobacteria bacterium]|nr:YHS domain-containing protein [Acidobacteriota bacterium]